MSDRNHARVFSARAAQRQRDDVSLTPDAAFDRANADIDAIFEEGNELERQGKLDADATKRIKARLQSVSERLDRDVANGLAAIAASGAIRTQPAWKKIAAVVLLLAFIGMPLEFTLGESFVFSGTNAYKSALPMLFALTLPVFAIVWFQLEMKQKALSSRFPTWAVRWLAMFPLMVVISSSMLVLSPFGWSALAGWAVGTRSQPMEARVLSIEAARHRAGKCDQKAMLDIDQVQVNICIEDRVIGPALQVGDTVSVLGRSSFFGLFIEAIRVKRPA